jgi:hypothetical protein
MNDLSLSFKDAKPAHLVNMLFLCAKLDLYEFCQLKLAALVETVDPDLAGLLM